MLNLCFMGLATPEKITSFAVRCEVISCNNYFRLQAVGTLRAVILCVKLVI